MGHDSDPATRGLAVEPVGSHVLLGGDSDADREREFLAQLPSRAGELVVLLASKAYARPAIAAELRAVLHSLAPPPDIDALRLAVDDLASWPGMLTALARAHGVRVLAPGGGLLFIAGTGILAGPLCGGTGWWAHEPDAPEPALVGFRYPAPSWEPGVPATLPGGLVTEPVLAGLLVRPPDGPPPDADDPVHRVVPDPDSPRLVLAGPAEELPPEDVAALIAALPDGTQVVSAAPFTASRSWLAGLERACGHRVPVATADGLVTLPDEDPDGDEETLAAADPQVAGVPGAQAAPERPRPVLPSVAPVVAVSADPTVPHPTGPHPTGPDEPLPEPRPVEVPPAEDLAEARSPREEPAAPAPRALLVADRDSTPDEQRRFALAAGEAFTEALATVNAAFATWPALRRDDTPGAKADLAAVCLYLAAGETGSVALDAALRGGAGGPVDGQLACLVSGLRRLPTHRSAVLRQSVGAVPAEDASLVGRLLDEPGFLCASAALDVTVPGAGLDVLIWPVTARRTGELTARPVDEAVFPAGARFKVLARRAAENAADGAPGAAVLVRELAAGERETSGPGALDDADRAALTRLERALARRHRTGPRVVDDAATAARLTATMAGLDAPAVLRAAPPAADPPLAVVA